MANTTGKKFGGRKAGTPNKFTATVKEAFREAFDKLGGVEALVVWGKKNPDDFYKLVSKLIPTEITGDPENPLESVLRVKFGDEE